jgi:hypothetical protein
VSEEALYVVKAILQTWRSSISEFQGFLGRTKPETTIGGFCVGIPAAVMHPSVRPDARATAPTYSSREGGGGSAATLNPAVRSGAGA